MLSSRGQENLVHARPTAGKVLQPKTPGNIQTPRTTSRAPLGAKTTNAKAQTILKDKQDAKVQVFKTPAPGQLRNRPEKPVNRLSTTKRSGKSRIAVASTESAPTVLPAKELEEEEPDFGYAPPTPIELPDPPMEVGYDETYPQFRPENMFRGYGEIYHGSPKDENGFSIRLNKEQEEYRKYQDEQEREILKKLQEEFSKPAELSDDEDYFPKRKIVDSKPDTLRSKAAVSALSSLRLPSAAQKQTASSRLKISKPVSTRVAAKTTNVSNTTGSRPLQVSKNTIGFPKARRPPSIVQIVRALEESEDDSDTLADELSAFDLWAPELRNDDEIFQL